MGKHIEMHDLEALMDEFEFETIEQLRSYIYYLNGVKEDYEYLKGEVKALYYVLEPLY